MIYLLGHKGFVGSAIEKYFQSKNEEVIGIGKENYDSFAGSSCDILINANGQSIKRWANEHPREDFNANVVSCLSSIFDFNSRKYILISTIDVYNEPSSINRTSEDTIIFPEILSPYGFDKYMEELVVKKHCKEWIILRLGGMVGEGLKKNAVFDLLNSKTLFVNPDSELPYMNTADVARILHALLPRNGIFNIVGDGTIKLRDLAQHMGIVLPKSLDAKKVEKYEINIRKLKSLIEVPKSEKTVLDFVSQWNKN